MGHNCAESRGQKQPTKGHVVFVLKRKAVSYLHQSQTNKIAEPLGHIISEDKEQLCIHWCPFLTTKVQATYHHLPKPQQPPSGPSASNQSIQELPPLLFPGSNGFPLCLKANPGPILTPQNPRNPGPDTGPQLRTHLSAPTHCTPVIPAFHMLTWRCLQPLLPDVPSAQNRLSAF